MSDIRLSASTFCAGGLFADGTMDLEGFVRTIAGIGYTGIELVSAQIVPGFPYPGDQWIENTRSMLGQYGVEPVAYGGYVDTVRFSGRDLSPEEKLSLCRNDLVIAHRLGAKILKTAASIGVETLRALREDCERWGVWIGLELHGPAGLTSEEWAPLVSLIQEDGGVHFGIVPDTCILQEKPHELFIRECLESGVTREMYDRIEGEFCRRTPLEEMIRSLALTPAEARAARNMYDGFANNMVADLPFIFQYSRYTHGKFFYIDYIDEEFRDRGIDFAHMVRIMREQGYSGYITAEYEGYFHDSTVDTVEQLERYYRLMRRILDQ